MILGGDQTTVAGVSRTFTLSIALMLMVLGGVPFETGPARSITDEVPVGVTPDTPAPHQPGFPIRAAFFYPWFPQNWERRSLPNTNYTPALGHYASLDDATIDQQLQLAVGAHLQAFIGSWWGRDHLTDRALQYIISRSASAGRPESDLRWAIYYEAEGQGDPTVDQIVSDMQYLGGTLFLQPTYLRVNGKPVVFAYADAQDGADMADRWAQAKARLGGSVYVVLKVYAGYRSDPNPPDGWHQYAPAVPYDDQTPYAVTVSPGFWKIGEQPRLAREASRFEADVQKMVASGVDWQLVTTWNEWGEGTGVEPTAEFGSTYLDILCRNLPGASDCARLEAPARTQGTPETAAAAAPVPPTPLPATTSSMAATGSVTVAAAGDIACGVDTTNASCRAMATSDLLLSLNPDAVLALGDIQYEKGAYTDFLAAWATSWGRLGNKVHPAVGNHEYLTSGASGYFDFFDGPDASTGPAGERGKGYYSFDLGAWHLIALNSNCAKVDGCWRGSAQEQWLRADLAAHPTACSLIFLHHPLWSSDSREFRLVELRPLVQAFYEAGGELMLVGHSHFYERFAPQDADGLADPARGVREIIVGTGGRNVYGFGPLWENSEVRDGRTFGVLKLTLKPTSYDWEFVPISGEAFTDSGTQTCH